MASNIPSHNIPWSSPIKYTNNIRGYRDQVSSLSQRLLFDTEESEFTEESELLNPPESNEASDSSDSKEKETESRRTPRLEDSCRDESKKVSRSCKRALFFEIETEKSNSSSSGPVEPSYTSISELYCINFLHVPLGQNANHFFEVRELVLEIETVCFKTKVLNHEAIRLRINKILTSSFSHSQKMGELGIILFYLDHPERDFPDAAESMIDYRAAEIEAEVTQLLKLHKSTDKRIPSGKTHYLLRAFAHMAMTSSQVYNRGGIYALLCILDSPQYLVTNYLRAEHHEHIIIVAKQILANPAFSGLFMRKIAVHPDLQDAIRIDLKLSPDELVTSVHVFWDCFMFLFHDIRQHKRPNCYAIGALIYAIENAPYKTLEKMISWLEGGHFVFNNLLGIPIAPLLEKRLVYSKDLQVELETEQAISLATFKHISSALRSPDTTRGNSASNRTAPLHAVLRTIVQAEQESRHLPYAEKLYYAFKYNTLSHLALGVMEFAYLNCPKPASNCSYSELKWNFLAKVMQEVEISVSKFPKGQEKSLLFFKIWVKFCEKFWFENCSEIDVLRNNDVVNIGTKEIRGFEGNLNSLVMVFEDSMRLFYLKDGDYVLLDSITDLKNAVNEIVDEAVNELHRETTLKIHQPTILQIKRHVSSRGFAFGISKYASNQINQRGISGRSLSRADLLLFKQKGGLPNRVLQRVFDLQVATQCVSGAMTPYEFVRNLLSVLQGLDTGLFQATPRILAFTLGSHIWTLSPNRLRLLFNSNLSFYDFIQSTIFDAANAHMRNVIPSMALNEVINRYAHSNPQLKEEIQKHFAGIRYLTYERVRSDFLENSSNYNLAKKVLDDVFGRVSKSQLDLRKIFLNLGLQMNRKIVNEIYKEALSKAPELIIPYKLALFLREQLLLHKIAIKDPYDIELAICNAHNLPIVFDIGDLNWDEGEYREDPPHPHLVIRYNWAERTLSFYHRRSFGESQTANQEFERFEIEHPQMAPSPHKFW